MKSLMFRIMNHEITDVSNYELWNHWCFELWIMQSLMFRIMNHEITDILIFWNNNSKVFS